MNPFDQFQQWFSEAQLNQEIEPTACALATSTTDGKPSVRIVLYKGIIDDQFAFVTNYQSRKGQELHANPSASACFYWKTLNKQIRIEGMMSKASESFSDRYWNSRPRESQLAASISPQSKPVDSYEQLETLVQSQRKSFDGKPIPRPKHWGGFFLDPHSIEFWSGHQYRLHLRELCTKTEAGWKKTILAP